ncbi:MAG: type IV pilus secretin PilQ [Deltaproteobacteria bacterium]|nr:type IV pilus secretin PilQ [Deltaproteobacteria bacterium]MBM4296621.1 type IV pilus secretin PilQ [Deltaproteobacteria bacterium]
MNDRNKHSGETIMSLFRPIKMITGSGIALGLAAGLLSCTPAAVEQPKPAASATQGTASVPRPVNPTPSQAATDAPAPKIQDFFARQEVGQTVLTLKLLQPIANFRHFPAVQPARLLLDIFTDAKQPGATESFRLATNLVSTARVTSGEGYMRVTLDILAANVPPYTITPEDGGVKITIGNIDPSNTDKKNIDFVKAGKRIEGKSFETTPGVFQAAGGGPQVTAVSRSDNKRYSGQRLSLDFKDADIKNVFRLLAEVSGLNIVVTSDVNNKVTLRLVDVPWDQALDLLIDTNGLGKEQVGNVVRISTAGQLKKERDDVAAAKKAEENLEPLETVYYNINYAKVKDLEAKVKSLQSKRPDASLVTDERSNTIMVRDVKKAVEDISTLVAKLDMRTPQVLIESNLIETTPTFARALGARLSFDLLGAGFSSGAAAATPFSGNSASFPNFANGLGATLSIIQNRAAGFRNLATALEAAENEGNIKIISRPSVVTLNNQASTIRSERILRIALPSSTNIATGSGSSAAGAAVATERVPVGIVLTVTPQVSSDGFVLMNINVKSSSIANSATVPDGSVGVVPFDELNREASASVLVKDGETIVLGGILKDTAQESQSGVPYLKNVPILGWLFKNHRIQKDFEELMVFITPRLTTAGSGTLPSAEQLWRDQLRRTEGDPSTPVVYNP